VFTIQGTLLGVTSNDPELPGRVAEALRLHGASDPAVVLYEDDHELGVVTQWSGKSQSKVIGEVAEVVECLIQTLLDSSAYSGRWYVDEEGDLPVDWASPFKRLMRRLAGRRRHDHDCVCSMRSRSCSALWLQTCPSIPHSLKP
jgi:hypothetical protein